MYCSGSWENDKMNLNSDMKIKKKTLEKKTKVVKENKLKGIRWKNRKNMMVEKRRKKNKQEKLRKRQKKVYRKCRKIGHNNEQCEKYCTRCNKWEYQRKMYKVVKEGKTCKGK